jgi:hypothetical protein
MVQFRAEKSRGHDCHNLWYDWAKQPEASRRGNYRSEGHPAPQLRMLASRTEIIDTLPRIVSKQWI